MQDKAEWGKTLTDLAARQEGLDKSLSSVYTDLSETVKQVEGLKAQISTLPKQEEIREMKKQLLAVCAAFVALAGAGCTQYGVQANAQSYHHNRGYQVGVGVNGYQPGAPRRVVGGPIAPQRLITEHAPREEGQFRCNADRTPSGGPGTGTGWCMRRSQ